MMYIDFTKNGANFIWLRFLTCGFLLALSFSLAGGQSESKDDPTPDAPAVPAAFSLVNGFTTCTGSALVSSISTTYPFGGQATKNNLIVMVVSNTAAASRSVSSPAGMQTILNDTTVDSRPSQSMFYKVAAQGDGNSCCGGIQINFGAPTRACYSFYEYSGVSFDSPLHGQANASGLFATTLVTGTAAPWSAGDLVTAGFFTQNTASWTGSFSGATNLFTDQTFGGVTGGSAAATSVISAAYSDCVAANCSTPSTSLTRSQQGTGWRGQIAAFYPKTTTAATAAGAGTVAAAGNARIGFTNVTAAGTTTVDSIDPTNPTQGAAPSGITYSSTSPAYNLTTTAVFSGTISVCINVTSVTDQTTFSKLKLLHKEGAALVDRTTFTNFNAHQVCGVVSALSPFIIANGLTPSAASVNLSGRIMTSDGAGLTRATVTLTDQNGNSQSTVSSSFGYYRIANLPAGSTYVVSVSSKRFRFLPRTVNISDELTDLDLIAEP